MRTIETHVAHGDKAHLVIEVVDEPGPGGACHAYRIGPTEGNALGVRIDFQKGGIAEHGVNGITNEALLAILEDRLMGFQGGPFPCQENEIALSCVREAKAVLHRRTVARIARGVEGKQQP